MIHIHHRSITFFSPINATYVMGNFHEIQAEGTFGNRRFEAENVPFSTSDETGTRLEALSIVRALLSRRASFVRAGCVMFFSKNPICSQSFSGFSSQPVARYGKNRTVPSNIRPFLSGQRADASTGDVWRASAGGSPVCRTAAPG